MATIEDDWKSYEKLFKIYMWIAIPWAVATILFCIAVLIFGVKQW